MMREGQAILEYAVLIGIVTAAILGMQVYAKRAIQAGVKVAADQIGDQREGARYESGDRRNRAVAAGGRVLERESEVRTEVARTTRIDLVAEGEQKRAIVTDTTTNTGALTERGPGVSAYSKVVSEAN